MTTNGNPTAPNTNATPPESIITREQYRLQSAQLVRIDNTGNS